MEFPFEARCEHGTYTYIYIYIIICNWLQYSLPDTYIYSYIAICYVSMHLSRTRSFSNKNLKNRK